MGTLARNSLINAKTCMKTYTKIISKQQNSILTGISETSKRYRILFSRNPKHCHFL